MYLSTLLTMNYNPDRLDGINNALNLFMDLNYNYSQLDLEELIDKFGDMTDITTIMSEVEDRINGHLIYIIEEMGIVLSQDDEGTIYEHVTLIRGLHDVVEYAVDYHEEVSNIIEGTTDYVECIIRLLDLVVKDMESGNTENYNYLIANTEESFWKRFQVAIDDANQSLIVPVEKPIVEKASYHGDMWKWVSESGRVGYNLDAAFKLHENFFDTLIEKGHRGNDPLVLVSELHVLVTFSAYGEDVTDKIVELLESLTQDPDYLVTAHSKIPYIGTLEAFQGVLDE